MDIDQIADRMKICEEEDIRAEIAVMEELRLAGLLEEGFGSRTRKEYIRDTITILRKHGFAPAARS